MKDGTHLGEEALRGIAEGRPPAGTESRHLLGCPSCRARLAERAPDAVLALLGALPAGTPAPPLPALPARRPGRVARTALAAAAAALLVLLLGVLRGPAEPPAWQQAPGVLRATVEAPGARVVTFVPRDPEAPVVTLVLDQEFDL